MILPEDFVGSTDRYSEKLLALPQAAFPFVPPEFPKRTSAKREDAPDAPARIAVSASVMKLNPRFFDALVRIVDQAARPVQFEFFPLGAVGLAHAVLARAVRDRLPGAIVHEEAPYQDYMARLALCDFFLSPFPYGNMNSIVDAVNCGLPGVCLDGDEAHAHADAGLFARLGFPSELIAHTHDEYASTAIELVDDPHFLATCRGIAQSSDLNSALFQGDASIFCRVIGKLIKETK